MNITKENLKSFLKQDNVEYTDIQEYLEQLGVRVITDIDEEIDIWAEYMKNKGYSFTELVSMLEDEIQDINEDYNYYILEEGYNYPAIQFCTDDIKILIEYILKNF